MLLMGAWFDRKDPGRTALRTLPFLLVVAFAIGSSGVTALHGRRPHGDATDIFTGNREVSVDSISAPVTSAAEATHQALDPSGMATERSPELPVWPPPPAASAVDPAANAMIGAPPMRVDWPTNLPPPHTQTEHTAGVKRTP